VKSVQQTYQRGFRERVDRDSCPALREVLYPTAVFRFNACHDFNSALNCLVREALDLGGMDGGAAYLIEGQEAVMQTHIGLDSTLVPQLARCPLSAGYIQAAMGRPPEMFDVRERFPEAGV